MPQQRWGRNKVEGTTVHGVRNTAKPYLTEGLSRTEKSAKSQANPVLAKVVAKVKAIIEKADYLHLSEADDKHIVRILAVKDSKAVGKNVRLTVEMETLKKRLKGARGVTMKTSTFALTCDPGTAKVSTNYKGVYKKLVAKFTAAVQKALRK